MARWQLKRLRSVKDSNIFSFSRRCWSINKSTREKSQVFFSVFLRFSVNQVTMEAISVKRNSKLGRFGVAARDLEAGEFLTEEFPFAIGPKTSTTCCCLECYCPVDATSSGSRCENCSWPLCVDCKKMSETPNHKRECEIFKAGKCKFFNLLEPKGICVQLDCVTPLRVFLAKESDPIRWKTEVEPMEHHRERRFGSPIWYADAQNVVGYLLGPCKLKTRGISDELIQQVIGILEVNSFEGRTSKGYSIRCLYTKIAVLSHSCTPNVFHSIYPTDGYKWVEIMNCLCQVSSWVCHHHHNELSFFS